MCLGLPMTVVEGDDLSALVEWKGMQRQVSMLLVGAQPVGTHLLVHMEMAMRVLEPEEAEAIRSTLEEALALSMQESREGEA